MGRVLRRAGGRDEPGGRSPVRGGTGRGDGDCRSACWAHENGLTKLVFTFPNSQRAQQFADWLFLAGYIDGVVEQNTVIGRGRGRQADRHHQGGRRPRRPASYRETRTAKSRPAVFLDRVQGVLCVMLGPRTGALPLRPL
jgi:hypothetical protein